MIHNTLVLTGQKQVQHLIMSGKWNGQANKRDGYRCACNEEACKKVTWDWCATVGHPLPMVKIVRQSYRDRLLENMTWPNPTLFRVVSKIGVHHFDIHVRHVANQRGDAQFQHNGAYVLPTISHASMMEEARLAGQIKRLDPQLYEMVIRPSLTGRGNGSFTFKHLVAQYNGLRLAAGERLFRKLRHNGKYLIRTAVKSVLGESLRQVPDNIAESEYLYHHIRKTEKSNPAPVHFDENGRITVTMPQTVFSRRSSARQKPKVDEDLILTLPTTLKEVMLCAIPMNESSASADDDIIRHGSVDIKDVISQGQHFEEVKLVQCQNKQTRQFEYIDEQQVLPPITRRGRRWTRSKWNRAHYFLVWESLTAKEVQAALDFCQEYNMTYLPVVLLFMFRFKGGRQKSTNEDEKAMQEINKSMNNNPAMVASIEEFEKFFEELTKAFLANIGTLHMSDMVRTTWYSWNIWNEESDALYDDRSRAQRAATRVLAGSNISTTERKMHLLLHYFTIMLHTQNMLDQKAERLYAQLTTNVPTNEHSLKLVKHLSFFEYYNILSDMFKPYGMYSQRAEAELAKMILIKVVYNNSPPANHDLLGFYQVKEKKVLITLNEYSRDTSNNPHCEAAGQDVHVEDLANLFAPKGLPPNPGFPRILCSRTNSFVRWNLNEITGELKQGLNSKNNPRRYKFALRTLADVMTSNPNYRDIIEGLLGIAKIRREALIPYLS